MLSANTTTDPNQILFQALETQNKSAITKILSDEIERIEQGLRRTINPDAQNENGDGFIHMAVSWGVIEIIQKMVVKLRFNLSLKNNKGQLVSDLDRRKRLQVPTQQRKKLETEEEQLRKHQALASRVKDDEEKQGTYHAGVVYTSNFSLLHSLSHSRKRPRLEIPDVIDPESRLSIHDTQAILEALAAMEHQSNDSQKEWRKRKTIKLKNQSVKKPIYNLVFDMHSSQEVCDSCQNKFFEFQREWTVKVERILSKLGHGIPASQPELFEIVFRASASRPPSSSYNRVPLEKRDEKLPFARICTHTQPMHFNGSGGQLLLHSDSEMQDRMSKWYDSESYRKLPIFTLLPKLTIFRNRDGISQYLPPEYVPHDVEGEIMQHVPQLHNLDEDQEKSSIVATVVDYLRPRNA